MRFRSVLSIAVILLSWVIPTQAQTPAHGTVSLWNAGLQHTLALGAYNGGGLLLYCPATAQYQMYVVPTAISITAVANNGSGAIRLTLAANSRTFHTGERILINSPPSFPALNNDFAITPIDATHIDLIGSTFVAGYPGGATVVAAAIGNATSIRINGTPASAATANTVYSIFLRWADAGCTYAEMSMTTSGSSLPPLSGPSFPIDNMGDYGTLVGIGNKRDIGSGVGATWQGNGQYQLLLSWYNRHWQTLIANVPGQVTSNSWAEFGGITNRIGFLTWGDEMGGQANVCLSIDVAVNFTAAQFGYVGVGVNGLDPYGAFKYTVTGAGTSPPTGVNSSSWFADALSGDHTICLTVPINNNIGGGWYEYAFYGKSQGPNALTLRNAVIGTSNAAVRVQF